MSETSFEVYIPGTLVVESSVFCIVLTILDDISPPLMITKPRSRRDVARWRSPHSDPQYRGSVESWGEW